MPCMCFTIPEAAGTAKADVPSSQITQRANLKERGIPVHCSTDINKSLQKFTRLSVSFCRKRFCSCCKTWEPGSRLQAEYIEDALMVRPDDFHVPQLRRQSLQRV